MDATFNIHTNCDGFTEGALYLDLDGLREA